MLSQALLIFCHFKESLSFPSGPMIAACGQAAVSLPLQGPIMVVYCPESFSQPSPCEESNVVSLPFGEAAGLSKSSSVQAAVQPS